MTSPVWRKRSVPGRKGAGRPCSYLQRCPGKRQALGGDFWSCKVVADSPFPKQNSLLFTNVLCAGDMHGFTNSDGLEWLWCLSSMLQKVHPITHEQGCRRQSDSTCPPRTEQDRACWVSFPGRAQAAGGRTAPSCFMSAQAAASLLAPRATVAACVLRLSNSTETRGDFLNFGCPHPSC